MYSQFNAKQNISESIANCPWADYFIQSMKQQKQTCGVDTQIILQMYSKKYFILIIMFANRLKIIIWKDWLLYKNIP